MPPGTTTTPPAHSDHVTTRRGNCNTNDGNNTITSNAAGTNNGSMCGQPTGAAGL